MRDVLVMTERLKAELPEMLREHQAIVAALEELTAAAEKEKFRSMRALRKSGCCMQKPKRRFFIPLRLWLASI
jgi:predicted metal-dependent hydrolase